MSTIKVNEIQNVAGTSLLTSTGTSASGPVMGQFGFKNRIINGAMMIDQRNNGASVGTGSGISVFFVDRWSGLYSQTNKFTAQQNGGSASLPEGFTNYLRITSSSTYSVGASEQFNLIHVIEGFNVADFGWGSASAQTVTLSFRVRSSLTGTFGGCLHNTGKSRAYPFTYTINAANTWETKTITVSGDISGTWNTTNGAGLYINFGLGVGSSVSAAAGSWTGAGNIFGATGAVSVVGTSGATFDVTGVQLEKGSVATPFDFRSIGQETALCQRYCFVYSAAFGVNSRAAVSGNYAANAAYPTLYLPVPLRGSPSITVSAASHFNTEQLNGGSQTCTSVAFNSASPTSLTVAIAVGSNLSFPINLLGNTTAARLIVSAEL